MNTLHAPPACRLALGMSRLTMRQAQQLRLATTAAVSTSSTLAPTTTEQPAPEENTRAERDAEEGRVHGHLPNHGQKIWIHNHTYDGHILYSFHRIVDTNKVYRQMPYTGKKLVPAKLRKDYWRPMAMIEFSPGLNEVGRSVFQKLREFKKRHELEWGRDDPEEEHRLLHMSKHERGKALNNQRPNSVADVAAVLGGVGKGTKMWMVDWNDLADKRVTVKKRGRDTVAVLQEAEKTNKKNLRLLAGMGISVEEAGERKFVDWQTITNLAVEVKGYKPAPEMPKKHPKEPKEGGQLVEGEALENEPKEGEKLVEAETQEKKPKEGEVPEKKPKAVRFVVDEESSIDLEPLKKLHTATIYWAKEQDLRYAREWTDNVEHVVGLPGDGTKRPHHLNRDGMKKWRAEKAARRGLPAVPEPASEIPQAASEVPQAAPVAA